MKWKKSWVDWEKSRLVISNVGYRQHYASSFSSWLPYAHFVWASLHLNCSHRFNFALYQWSCVFWRTLVECIWAWVTIHQEILPYISSYANFDENPTNILIATFVCPPLFVYCVIVFILDSWNGNLPLRSMLSNNEGTVKCSQECQIDWCKLQFEIVRKLPGTPVYCANGSRFNAPCLFTQ